MQQISGLINQHGPIVIIVAAMLYMALKSHINIVYPRKEEK